MICCVTPRLERLLGAMAAKDAAAFRGRNSACGTPVVEVTL